MINLQIFFKYALILLVIGGINISCRPHHEPNPCFETYNDFEHSVGWVESLANNSQTVSKDAGYKSNYGCKVNRWAPFGYIFKLNFKGICPEKVSDVKVNFLSKKNSALTDSCSVVCSILDSSGKVILWREISLKDAFETGKWTTIEKQFSIGAYYKPENTVSVSFWNHGSLQEIFIDNIKLEFY